jgi:hypothetical protein
MEALSPQGVLFTPSSPLAYLCVLCGSVVKISICERISMVNAPML